MSETEPTPADAAPEAGRAGDAATGAGAAAGTGQDLAVVDEQTHERLRRAAGALSTTALQRMDERLGWYRALGPEDRSWIGLVAQAGISAFIAWYGDQARTISLSSHVFGTAPRELTRSISLQQTLELLRTVVDVVESQVGQLATPGHERALTDSALRYSRDIAFAAAEVYARAAEERGAWDARTEALVVDALVRSEPEEVVRSRAAAVGWDSANRVTVVAGWTPTASTKAVVDGLRRTGRTQRADILVGVQGDRVVVVAGHRSDPVGLVPDLAAHLGPGQVVVGPEVDGLEQAGRSVRAALNGLVAVRAWPQAPCPVEADDLLPERMMSGDSSARRLLADRVYVALDRHDGRLLDTLAAYLESGRSVEAAARQLFVHSNTVRYRLRKTHEITGWDPLDPREGYILHVGLTVGRLAVGPPGRPWRDLSGPHKERA